MTVRTSNAAVGLAIVGILVWLGAVGTIIWVAAHFLGKYW